MFGRKARGYVAYLFYYLKDTIGTTANVFYFSVRKLE